MNPSNPLDSIYYITLPENSVFSSKATHIDPTIPLPVQKKTQEAENRFDPTEITEEQLLAGMLTVLAYEPKNEHIQYYRSLLKEARPNLQKELTEAAILKAKNEDFGLAEEIFDALRGFDPDDQATILNTALFYDQRADADRRAGLNDEADAYDDMALRYYKDAMDAEEPAPDAFFNAGFYFLKKNDYAEAKGCFETYLALTCDISDEEMGENGIYKKNRAQEIINDISNRNIDDDHYKNAYKLISSGQEEKGLEELRLFLESHPDVWNAWFMLGWGLRLLGRYDDAKAAFNKTLSFDDGKNADTYNELAICCMESGDLKEAKKNLEAALTLSPENTKVISNLGVVAQKEGKTEEAEKYFKLVLELDPKDKIARQMVEG